MSTVKAKTAKQVTRKKATKSTAMAIVKRSQIVLKQDYETRLAEFNERQGEVEKTIRDWGQRLAKTQKGMAKLNEAYRQFLYKLLQEAYAVYKEARSSELADDFFAELRYELKSKDIKIQSNTTDAALIIRFVCGADVATKTVHDYSRVLMGAEHNNIKTDGFAEWLQQQTMTKVIQNQREIENQTETRADRMNRARRVVMRLIEARETKPLLTGKTTAWQAEKMLSKDGMWVGIGNATRRMDRESFYADINLAIFLPPNIDIEFYIINGLARQIVDGVEKYEEQIATLEESVWSDELWEQLVSAGFEESEKTAEYWSNRQQAARYENQQDFIEEVIKPKKRKKKAGD
jgi:uncharacterized coiled-coil protein SlyX